MMSIVGQSLPLTVNCTVPKAPQDAASPFVRQGTLLAHTEPAVNQDAQIPFCRAMLALQALIP